MAQAHGKRIARSTGTVKLSAIALDYDGTIAQRDVLDPAVRTAIADARTRGILVLLVTGRILDQLRHVVGDLHFVDGVVAENGALLHFPQNGHTSRLASPVSRPFVDELQRRGIPCVVGQCLIDAAASEAPRLLDVIRALELPLVLLFNGGRVMTLPQGISKATGLQTALNTLRISARNTVAVGDAENDHEMLRLSELGVAVSWGSAALAAAADVTLVGSGPPAVADLIRTISKTGLLPIPGRARRRLLLGYLEDGREFSLAVRGRNVLVAGDPKSGKSWVAGLLCEQLILHGYCLCVIDPEGDYGSLEALPGVSVLGGEDPPPTPRDLLRALGYPDRSVVVDLSRLAHDDKIAYVRALLPALNQIRRRTGLPHRIILDEAHYFLHDDDATALIDLDREGYTVVTYRASKLPKILLAKTEVIIVTSESNPAEIEALCRCCPTCAGIDPAHWSVLGRLRLGEAIALPITDEAGGELRLFTMAARFTPHVRHRAKYVDVPVSHDKAFVFESNGGAPHRARTLRQFVYELEGAPNGALDAYVRRCDFSRWIKEVYGDYPLAAQMRLIETRHRTSPRADDLSEIVGAIRARYDLTSDGVGAKNSLDPGV